MDKQNNMNRRDFLKIVGISAATTTAVLSGCTPKNRQGEEAVGPVPKGR